MPIYEYRCNRCLTKFEKLVFSFDINIECPDCKSADVERIMSTFAFSSVSKNGEVTKSSLSSSCATCTATTCSGCK